MKAIGDVHIDLGAYALGLLEEQDRTAFEAHLATCEPCKAELTTLSPTAAVLQGLDPVELPGDAETPPPPVDLLHKRAALSRRRFRWQVATNAATGVTGTVGLVSKAWGTQVTLDLADVHGPLQCQLIAVSKNGTQKVVAGWFVPAPGDGVPGHPAHLLIQGGTAIALTDLAHFEVTVDGGPTLLTIPV